jgi:3-oxoacyl-[acyl-carrier-protein] synthase II
MRRVVITGVGPITPIGIGKEKCWEAIKEGKSAIAAVSKFDTSIFEATSAGELLDWKPEEFFSAPIETVRPACSFRGGLVQIGPPGWGLEYAPDNPQERVGVSFGTALGRPCVRGGVSSPPTLPRELSQKTARNITIPSVSPQF